MSNRNMASPRKRIPAHTGSFVAALRPLINVVVLGYLVILSDAVLAGDVADNNPGQRKFHAVIVGSGDHDEWDNAKQVADALKALGPGMGWVAGNINLLAKGGANKAAIEAAINAAKNNAKPGDEFLFYFVGHGHNGAIGVGENDPDGKLDSEVGGDDAIDEGPDDVGDTKDDQIVPGDNGKIDTERKGNDVDSGAKDGVMDGNEQAADPKDEPDRFDNYVWVDGGRMTDDELAKMLSGFQFCVSIEVVLDACFSASFADGSADLNSVTQKKDGQDVKGHKPQFEGATALCVGELTRKTVKGLALQGNTTAADTNGVNDGKTTLGEIYRFWETESVQRLPNYDDDGDGLIDEDPIEHYIYGDTLVVHLGIDNDGDGLIDEDPGPLNYSYRECGGTDIPTLSEWGAIIFGTLLLASVVFYIWRRRRLAVA